MGSGKVIRISGCINRDKNAILNMERIVKGLIDSGERLSIFKPKNNQGHRSKVKSKRETTSDAKSTVGSVRTLKNKKMESTKMSK